MHLARWLPKAFKPRQIQGVNSVNPDPEKAAKMRIWGSFFRKDYNNINRNVFRDVKIVFRNMKMEVKL
jgi:hypothetical protein